MGWFTSIVTSTYRYYRLFFQDSQQGKGIHIEMSFNNPKEDITLDFPDTGGV